MIVDEFQATHIPQKVTVALTEDGDVYLTIDRLDNTSTSCYLDKEKTQRLIKALTEATK